MPINVVRLKPDTTTFQKPLWGAIDTMTIGLAREVAEEGIRVNAVRVGHSYTELHALGR